MELAESCYRHGASALSATDRHGMALHAALLATRRRAMLLTQKLGQSACEISGNLALVAAAAAGGTGGGRSFLDGALRAWALDAGLSVRWTQVWAHANDGEGREGGRQGLLTKF